MFLALLILLAVSLAFLIRRQYTYWERTNIPHLKPSFPFGVVAPVVKKQRIFGLTLADIYENSKEKILGINILFKPTLLIRDVQITRQILTADFGSFHDRGLYIDTEHDPLNAGLFNTEGQDWRLLRAKLTPAFTSGKLKGMFDTIDDVGNMMIQYFNKELKDSKDGKTFELKEIMTTYAVDLIASSIFGLDVDSYSNPDNEFRHIHSRFFSEKGIRAQIFNLASLICPPLAKFVIRTGYRDPTLRSLLEIVKRTIDFRERHKVVRRDLLHMLIQLKNTGKISEDDDKVWDVETVAENLKAMSIEIITANCFLFYIAGTETTATTSSLTIYELSMYPDLLKRAQTEIEDVLQKHGLKPSDKFTYEALQDMKFLELCIMETTRKYPGLPFLNRQCTQDYKVPGTEYVIQKGTSILIALHALHRDPEYFPEPDRYNPERFNKETRNYDPAAFMPFGEGPRHCIAMRMGKMNSKLAVAKVLANYNVRIRPCKELEFSFIASPVLIPKEGLNVHLSKKH